MTYLIIIIIIYLTKREQLYMVIYICKHTSCSMSEETSQIKRKSACKLQQPGEAESFLNWSCCINLSDCWITAGWPGWYQSVTHQRQEQELWGTTQKLVWSLHHNNIRNGFSSVLIMYFIISQRTRLIHPLILLLNIANVNKFCF